MMALFIHLGATEFLGRSQPGQDCIHHTTPDGRAGYLTTEVKDQELSG